MQAGDRKGRPYAELEVRCVSAAGWGHPALRKARKCLRRVVEDADPYGWYGKKCGGRRWAAARAAPTHCRKGIGKVTGIVRDLLLFFCRKGGMVALGQAFYVYKKNYATFPRIFCLHNNVENSVDNVQNPLCGAIFRRLLFWRRREDTLTFLKVVSLFVRLRRRTCHKTKNAI